MNIGVYIRVIPGSNPVVSYLYERVLMFHLSIIIVFEILMICNVSYIYINMFDFSDIDECSTNRHNCHVNASCLNTDGSFICTCNETLNIWGDGTSCSRKYVICRYVRHAWASTTSIHTFIIQQISKSYKAARHAHISMLCTCKNGKQYLKRLQFDLILLLFKFACELGLNMGVDMTDQGLDE